VVFSITSLINLGRVAPISLGGKAAPLHPTVQPTVGHSEHHQQGQWRLDAVQEDRLAMSGMYQKHRKPSISISWWRIIPMGVSNNRGTPKMDD